MTELLFPEISMNPDNKFHRGSGDDGKHYWLTPPDLYARLDAEFHFDFDPCPYPLPDGFDGLTCEWGQSNYVNPPFGTILHNDKIVGPTAWVRKAIHEYRKGKTVVFVWAARQVGTHARGRCRLCPCSQSWRCPLAGYRRWIRGPRNGAACCVLHSQGDGSVREDDMDEPRTAELAALERLAAAVERLPHNGSCAWQSGNDDCDCHKADALNEIAALHAASRPAVGDGLREIETLLSVRSILDKHIIRLGRYYSSTHIVTFAREAIAEIDAALAADKDKTDD